MWWDCRPFTPSDLEANEDDNKQTKPKQAAPNSGITPGICGAAPLKGEQQADNSADEEKGSSDIDLSDALVYSHSSDLARGRMEEEVDSKQCHSAEWKVNPEAVMPC